jgi:signal peptidase I
MEPTFHTGSLVLASNAYWLVGKIQKDDIVLITMQDEEKKNRLIKRVTGVEGDSIQPKDAPLLFQKWDRSFTIPKGGYYVMGDNRANSTDSRDFGCVKREELSGKCIELGMFARMVPFSSLGLVVTNYFWLRSRKIRRRRIPASAVPA